MKSKIIGRQEELDFFQKIMLSKKAELGILYGRRRIGKSFLLKNIPCKKKYYFEAVKQLSLKKQVAHFLKQFSEQEGLPPLQGSSWEEAFDIVTPYFQKGRLLVVFDELPWMASEQSALVALLKFYWDNYWKNNNQICLVLCGSIAQFMIHHVVHSEALHNRKTFERKIKALPSNQSLLFFKKNLSDYERTLFLMTIGGIPKYLEQVKSNISFYQNLREEFFNEHGFFFKEFETIFKEQFKTTKTYEKIIRELSAGAKTLAKLGQSLNLEGGGFSEYLDNLSNADLVSKTTSFDFSGNEKSKTKQFQLSDEFIKFYLNFVDPHRHLIEKGLGLSLTNKLERKLDAYYGLAFELFCNKNIALILQALKIQEADILQLGPYFTQASRSKNGQSTGVQVDLMIILKKKRILICECKFTKDPVGMFVISEMQNKIKKLKIPKNYSISPVLISANGATKEVISSEFFDFILKLEVFYKN